MRDPLSPSSFRIIPAIDLLDGQAVRLHQGDYATARRVAVDPVATAQSFVAAGARRIHIVDLSGARGGHPAHLELIESIVDAVEVAVEVGGGLRSAAQVRALLERGVEQVILGTAAIEDPALLASLTEAWPGRVLVGLDARGERVALRGWLEEGAEDLPTAAQRVAQLPIAGIVYTDIHRDGTGKGPNVERTAALARAVAPTPVIASGGVGDLSHLEALSAQREGGICGAIVGRALYDGAVDLDEAVRRFDTRESGS